MREYLLVYKVRPRPGGPAETVRLIVESVSPRSAGQRARDQIRREHPGAEIVALVSRTVRVTRVHAGKPNYEYREA